MKKKKGGTKKRAKNKTVPVRSLKGLTIRQAAAVICARVSAIGYDPVVIGKGCAAIYGGGAIRANSLEVVVSEYVASKFEKEMRKLGLTNRVQRTFSNKVANFEVTFMPPPVAVGDNVVEQPSAMKTPEGTIGLLDPTDCVRHRLSAYYRFGEADALTDAVVVAKRHDVDMDLIRRWSQWEWASDKYEDFEKLMKE
jgi:hypothetical protein